MHTCVHVFVCTDVCYAVCVTLCYGVCTYHCRYLNMHLCVCGIEADIHYLSRSLSTFTFETRPPLKLNYMAMLRLTGHWASESHPSLSTPSSVLKI